MLEEIIQHKIKKKCIQKIYFLNFLNKIKKLYLNEKNIKNNMNNGNKRRDIIKKENPSC